MHLTAQVDKAAHRDYSIFQVLETPKQRKAAPVRSCGFFVPIVFLWAGVRGIQYLQGELLRRLFTVSSSRPPARNGFLEILKTEVQP